MTTWTFEATKRGYANLWNAMTVGTSHTAVIETLCKRGLANKDKYVRVQSATGVPWWFVWALHARESSCDFSTHLHNGDPLTAKTRHVPAGRPLTGSAPFDWWYSATDALTMKGFHLIKSWTIERQLFSGERYNGTGYVGHGENSPYVWAGSNIYDGHGKYVNDGSYDPNFSDKQPGIAPLIRRMSELDQSIALLREARTETQIAQAEYGQSPNKDGLPYPIVEDTAVIPEQTEPAPLGKKEAAQVHRETVATLADNGSRTINGLARIRSYLRAIGAALGITSLADVVTTKQQVGALVPGVSTVPDIHPAFLVCGALVFAVTCLIAYELFKIEQARVDDAHNYQQDRGIE